ncbi:MAG: ImmA/IrrE family metallo-endopeptidase [Nanoarchaeota archaeon]|nr:ImmA/IrrE family metallo-endopeptidase [Nanoarchaeota archaeon]MBU4284522.1 ImmA/IrrE family metallo-endopeptidase [Nanoarchaeota archaeon]MBU4493177.1 ImmA/IrrE family metallo-endopeptidase [Nanoarchaeota archaeon]
MDDLEKTIKKNPLSRENIELILKTKVKEVIFWPMIASAALYFSPILGGYIIKINSRQTKKEQKIDLIHEIAHIAYNLVDLETPRHWEELLERESERFYKENKDSINQIYKLAKKWRAHQL